VSETHDIEAIKARDAKALDRLVREESGRVYRCVGRMIRDDDEIQSLTQETFLQAILNIDSFRGDSKISTWLCSIAINLARAHLRKTKRYDVLEESDIEGLLPTFGLLGHGREVYTDWNPEEHTERSERVEMVHAALNRLPDDYREVIVLRDLEEMNTEEVAEVLGISEGAVRVRLHRARQALRTLIDKKLRE
jgi:RNA polymerase sigma-70 factor (ECF subfamily)